MLVSMVIFQDEKNSKLTPNTLNTFKRKEREKENNNDIIKKKEFASIKYIC